MNIQSYNIEELINKLTNIFPHFDQELIWSVLFEKGELEKTIDYLLEITNENIIILQKKNKKKNKLHIKNGIINSVKKIKINKIFKKSHSKYQILEDDTPHEPLYILDTVDSSDNLNTMEWDYGSSM